MRSTSPFSACFPSGFVPERRLSFKAFTRTRRFIACALMTCGAFALPLQAGPGDLDLSFGGTGKVSIPVGGYSGSTSVLVQPDGKIILAGGNPDVVVVRLDANGTLDTTFNGTGKLIKDYGFAESMTCAALQADGKIIVGGTTYDPANGLNVLLVRLSPDGSPDPGFGGTGFVTTDIGSTARVSCMALQSDGRILVAGSTNNDTAAVILRYKPDGSPDTSFNGTGRATSASSPHFYAMVVQSDGRIALTGQNNSSLFVIMRYNPNGLPDMGFGGSGVAATGFGYTSAGFGIAQQSDGKLVAVGTYAGPNSGGRVSLARCNANGTLDTTFNGTGRVTTPLGSDASDWASSVIIQPDGRILVCGAARYNNNSGQELTLLRYSPGGILDTTFHGTGSVILTGVHPVLETAMALQGDGKILVTGGSGGGVSFMAHRLVGGPPPAPDIIVEQPAGTVLSHRTTKSFGYVIKDGTSTMTFTVRNSGTLDLTEVHASVDGANMADYTVTAAPAAVVAADKTTTLTVQFSPHAVGFSTATLYLTSNDPDENPLEIILTGTGTATSAGDLRVEQPPGTEIPDGGSSSLNSVNASTLTMMEFTLKNTGPSTLGGFAAVFDGPNAGLFSLLSPLTGQLASGETRTVAVRFAPDSPGVKTATLHVYSSDPDESPYDITLTGTTVPEVTVQQLPGTFLVSSGPAPVNFGPVLPGTSVSLTFSVKNTGWGDLNGITLTKSAAGTPGDFTVTGPGVNELTFGAATQFTVTFTPSAAGARTATLNIASNAPGGNPFVINLTGALATALEAWRHQYFGILTNTGTAADLSDPDGDGIVNLMEFATGSHPAAKNSPPGTLVKTGTSLEMTWPRLKTALDELNYTLEWSNDPAGTWSTVGSTAATVLSDNGVTEMVKSTVPAGTGSRRFVRLRVTRR